MSTSKERQETKVTVVEALSWQHETWLPENLINAIAWLKSALEQVPQEYRAQAKVEIGKDEDGDATLEVYYVRLETDEELAARLANYRSFVHEYERQERAQLQRLLAKYGPPTPS